ncbi:MAG TPA: bifunctional DNA-formamidopyrimidine glycosylase/DNA-(apurinic or apyrimidinic site) lyase [Pyrinomonadaceae bacterium]|nr:bifunctional DNA-formamidopyrimidine glycosylase/DNA-(apurinic or apyrimidinic site) lyase [Pyrinomonadaceae bacterium]
MPELPEVEHVVRALRGSISGNTIITAELRLRRIAHDSSPAVFNRKLRDARIEDISRRGKQIVIHLDNNRVLLVHLRMTGKFVSLKPEQPLPPHAHVIFYLNDDRRLVYCDMRQFGRMRVAAASRLAQSRELRPLAPEPLSDDFSQDYLLSVLSRSRRTLKQLLLDQTKIVGLGNIYASEALFLASVHPLTIAGSLSSKRGARLHEAIRTVLKEAIAAGSTLRIDLADANESYFGAEERFWRVYERDGEPCVNCGRLIRRVVHAGRSTYFCSRCQRR